MVQYIRAMQERLLRESRSDLLRFTLATMPTFRPADFHRRYYSVLTSFAHGEIKKLMVFMPPQHRGFNPPFAVVPFGLVS